MDHIQLLSAFGKGWIPFSHLFLDALSNYFEHLNELLLIKCLRECFSSLTPVWSWSSKKNSISHQRIENLLRLLMFVKVLILSDIELLNQIRINNYQWGLIWIETCCYLGPLTLPIFLRKGNAGMSIEFFVFHHKSMISRSISKQRSDSFEKLDPLARVMEVLIQLNVESVAYHIEEQTNYGV